MHQNFDTPSFALILMRFFPFQCLFGKSVHLPWMVGLVGVFTFYGIVFKCWGDIVFAEPFPTFQATCCYH